jgi:RNA polymerase sigma-70 factor (ECF subfamily)
MHPDDLPDSELILRVRGGDGSAYRPLVERYQNRVHAMVYGMVRDAEEARDITQNAFIKAYQNLATFRIESSFYTWLYRIAMNLAIDQTRKNRRRKTTAYDEALASRDEDGNILEAHQSESPQKALQRKQLHERIFAALDELSEEQREVILLREVEGLSYKEIADAMGIPEGTVMSRLFYARKRLQGLLQHSTGEM